jgi:hypothetical protein
LAVYLEGQSQGQLQQKRRIRPAFFYGWSKNMRKALVVVALLALAVLLYLTLSTDEREDKLASPVATGAGSAAKSGAPANAAASGGATVPSPTEPGSRPAPIRMSTTGTIIGPQRGRDASAAGR